MAADIKATRDILAAWKTGSRSGPAGTKLGSLQFRSVEMATLQQGNGQFKYPSPTSLEYELLPALWHRTGGAEPVLIVGASSGSPLNDNPSPTAGTCHGRAHNPIRHSTIIGRPRAGRQPRCRMSFPREPSTYLAHRTRIRRVIGQTVLLQKA